MGRLINSRMLKKKFYLSMASSFKIYGCRIISEFLRLCFSTFHLISKTNLRCELCNKKINLGAGIIRFVSALPDSIDSFRFLTPSIKASEREGKGRCMAVCPVSVL